DAIIAKAVDSLAQLGGRTKENESKIESAENRIGELQAMRAKIISGTSAGGSADSRAASKLLEAVEQDIYYIYVTEFRLGQDLDMFDEALALSQRWSGTGFLADDGRFY